jgi:hypothetical protein
MKRFFWILLAIGLGIITAAGFITAFDLTIYLDLTPFLLVVLIPFLILLTQYSLREMGNYFRQAREKTQFSYENIQKGLIFFTTMQRLLIGSTIIVSILGLIAILRYIDDSAAIVGTRFGVLFIAVLYSTILITFITIPYIGALKKKLVNKPEK